MAAAAKDAAIGDKGAELWSLSNGVSDLPEYLRRTTAMLPPLPAVEVRYRRGTPTMR